MTTSSRQMASIRAPAAAPAINLTPVISQKYAADWKHVVVCLWFVLLFMYTNHVPLSHTGVWRHASMGRWVNHHQRLPTAHPLVPLAGGMPYANVGWLSETVMARVLQRGGVEAISGLSTILVVCVFAVWGVQFYAASRQKRYVLLALSLLAATWFARLSAPGPEWIGGLCFAALMGLTAKAAPWRVLAASPSEDAMISAEQRPSRWHFAAVAIVMALWANVDQSFVIGLVVLAAIAVGHLCNAVFPLAMQRWQNPFALRQVQAWVWMVEVAVLSTLVNPRGVVLWQELLRRDGNPVWQEWGGWRPLQLASTPGILFVLLWLLLFVVWRRSRLPVVAAEALTAGAISTLVALNAALIVWLAPVILLVSAKHWRSATQAQRSAGERHSRLYAATQPEAPPLRFALSLLCVLLVWGAFALSPISTPLLGGTPRSVARQHTKETPLAVSAFLRTAGVRNLVWAPSYWADWLLWDAADQAKCDLFTDSHVWQLPRRVQADYARIYQGEGNWQRVADRYAVHTLVIDKQKQLRLAAEVMRNGNRWEMVYEDESALVMSRVGI